ERISRIAKRLPRGPEWSATTANTGDAWCDQTSSQFNQKMLCEGTRVASGDAGQLDKGFRDRAHACLRLAAVGH
ncbi:hypothetical protein, partial [Paraburkholderia sp. J8-2]|uniref:hypothetical protein n=1 Tax=Paraburkholderia sp. J8-2 TaxID=2805440 RepID=UPI002AB6CC57